MLPECVSSIWTTVWKRMIAIASLTMPSPKIIENSFGLSLNFTIVSAATASDAHSVALNSNISGRVS